MTGKKAAPKKRRVSTVMGALLLMGTVLYVPLWVHTHSLANVGSSAFSSSGYYTDTHRRFASNDQSPIQASATIQALEKRVQYLETKVNAYLAYTSDPFLRMKTPAKCRDQRQIKDLACPPEYLKRNANKCEIDNQLICLDDFPYDGKRDKNKNNMPSQEGDPPCLVYDFGIRESPDYGLAFNRAPFRCEVVGFDPSPISVAWWGKNRARIQKTEGANYSFQPFGAGGVNGDLTLREYDWGQVSILSFPLRTINRDDCNNLGQCRYHFHKEQATHTIPVKTLQGTMETLGHSNRRITLLKLDVEGSEYMFLERMIDDLTCRQVDQLTLEWHHYDYDVRYGVTSNPQINLLVALLEDQCGLQQYWTHESTGWPSNVKLYSDMGMTLYYTLSSFKRVKWNWDN